MKITKTSLRKRWKNQDFINNFPLPLDKSIDLWKTKKKLRTLETEKLNNIDLRGISDDELWFFPHFSNNSNVDFSYGRGAVNFYGGECYNINLEEFNFDRATYFKEIKMQKCNFRKSKLIFDASDTIFEDCDFSDTIFKGGFNEYGFRRCTFINCLFDNSQWKNLYIRACKFKSCSYNGFEIQNAIVTGFKVDKLNDEIEKLFIDCDVQGLIEI